MVIRPEIRRRMVTTVQQREDPLNADTRGGCLPEHIHPMKILTIKTTGEESFRSFKFGNALFLQDSRGRGVGFIGCEAPEGRADEN